MDTYSTLPLDVVVVSVDSRTVRESWSALRGAIGTADCIAIDLEMSGIGALNELAKKYVDIRYSQLCQVVSSHSVLSLGVACFKGLNPTLNDTSGKKTSTNAVTVQSSVFDVLLFCQTPYTVDPHAVQFLLSHGFDFNTQYRYGLPYTPAFTEDQPLKEEESEYSIRKLFLDILGSQKPVIFHNGLIDLMFVYHHFYTALPSKHLVFAADLCEMFVGGVYDTKRIPLPDSLKLPSYLEYLFHKSWWSNSLCCSKDLPYYIELDMARPDGPSEMVKLVTKFDDDPDIIPEVCQQYAERGYCSQISTCGKSHNINHVIATEVRECVSRVKKKKRKRNRSRGHQNLGAMFSGELAQAKKRFEYHENGEKEGMMDSNEIEGEEDTCTMDTRSTIDDKMENQFVTDVEQNEVKSEISAEENAESLVVDESVGMKSPLARSHKSGSDAFATGFYFLKSGLDLITGKETSVTVQELISSLQEHMNKVPLTAKRVPLLLMKSQYCDNSLGHKRIQQSRTMTSSESIPN